MELPLRVALAFALMYAAVLAAWWAIPGRTSVLRMVIGVIAIAVTIFAAMVIPLDAPILRAGVAVLGAITGPRISSYWLEGGGAPLGEYLRFISIGPLRPYLVFALNKKPAVKLRIGREVLRFLICATIIPATWLLAGTIVLITIAQDVWPLNHLIVLTAFVIIMTCVGQVLLAIWRLQGMPVRQPFVDNILASRTPAEFWRRWSWPTHVSLHRYIYQPLGGRRHHIRATLAVFFASGVAHEILFFVALGRFTGHQMLYFLASGVGVLASPALERLSAFGLGGRALMRTLTIAFLIACSPLFFVSVHYVLPIYVREIWLMW